ncbi:21837_t:CDS:2, partial [Dentiscutata erythropus]
EVGTWLVVDDALLPVYDIGVGVVIITEAGVMLTGVLSLDYTGHIPVLRHWTAGHSNLISPIWSSPVPLATGHSK